LGAPIAIDLIDIKLPTVILVGAGLINSSGVSGDDDFV